MTKVKTVLAIIDKARSTRVGFVGWLKEGEYFPATYHVVERSSGAADFTGYGYYIGNTCDELNKAHTDFDFRAVTVKT